MMQGRATRLAFAAAAFVAVVPAATFAIDTTAVWTFDGNQASAHVGYSVAAAGDVNGDGFADLLAAARSYNAGQTNEGRAHLFLGGPAGPSLGFDWSAEGDQNFAFLGTSVAPAGDVNGDGFGDVIVGVPSWDGAIFPNEGQARVYLGSASGLAPTPVWEVEGGQSGATFGTSVATAGDVNGDGFADVLVGARGFDGSEANSGRVLLYLGGASGLSIAPAWMADGDQNDPGFGISVATAGDVNGDGYDDVLYGAFRHDGSASDAGAAYVHFGGPAGPSLVADWEYSPNQSSAAFGYAVAPAGDVNGDGYADVVIGARDWNGVAGSDCGAAFVFHGGAAGPSLAPDRRIEGAESGSHFGWSVGPAGDTNGDGFADVIVGAPEEDVEWLDDGSARVFLGAAAGLDSVAVWLTSSGQVDAAYGWSVSGAGDVDGDGFGDVLVGAYFFTDTQSDEGRAFLFRGGATPPATLASWKGSAAAGVSFGQVVRYAGDVDGDGFSDVLVGDPLADFGFGGEGRVDLFRGAPGGPDVTPDWSIAGTQADENLSRALAAAGDVDGDGYDDVLVGAPRATEFFQREGRVWWYPGSAFGLALAAPWDAGGAQLGANFGAALTGLGDVEGDGFADFAVGAPGWSGGTANSGAVFVYAGGAGGPGAPLALPGAQAGARFGASVAGVGDVNGDGFRDLVIGEPSSAAGAIEAGRAHLYLGGASGFGPVAAWSAAGGQVGARFGESVARAGDVNGDGYADVLVAAPGWSGGEVEEGKVALFLGGPAGLAASPSWEWESGQPGAQLTQIGSAGDLNADGLADVVVGLNTWIDSAFLEGRAVVFAGNAKGSDLEILWDRVGGSANGRFGSSVDGAYDPDGDGWPDLLIGAQGHADSTSAGGAAFLFSANGAPGGPQGPRLRHPDGSPLAVGGRVSGTGVRFDGLGRTAAGRTDLAWEWEVRDATGQLVAAGTTAPQDPGAPAGGTALAFDVPVNGLPGNVTLFGRGRVRTASPWFGTSPWFVPQARRDLAWHLRTTGAVSAPRPAPGLAAPYDLRVSPQPSRADVTFRFAWPSAGRAALVVYGVDGRRLGVVSDAWRPAGPTEVRWDGCVAGRPLPTGVYFVRLSGPSGTAVTRLVRHRVASPLLR